MSLSKAYRKFCKKLKMSFIELSHIPKPFKDKNNLLYAEMFSIIKLCINSSSLIYPQDSESTSGVFEWLSDILQFLRLDSISASFGFDIEFLFFLYFLILLPVLCFFIRMLTENQKVLYFLPGLIKFSTFITQKLLVMPILLSLVMSIRTGFMGKTEFTHDYSNSFYYSAFSGALSLFFLALYILEFLVWFYFINTWEFYNKNRTIFATSSSIATISFYLPYFLEVILFYVFGDLESMQTRVVLLFVFSVCALLKFKQIPFFNPRTNILVNLSLGLNFWGLLIYILAEYFESLSSSYSVFVISAPFYGFVLYLLSVKRIKRKEDNSKIQKTVKQIEDAELFLASLLENQESNKTYIKELTSSSEFLPPSTCENFKKIVANLKHQFPKEKKIYVLEAYFYIYAKKYEKVLEILAKSYQLPPKFELTFQVIKIQNYMSNHKPTKHLSYFKYQKLLQKVKTGDYKTCLQMLSFFSELKDNRSSAQQREKKLLNIERKLTKTIQRYKNLLADYPTDQSLKLYFGFKNEIMFEYADGTVMETMMDKVKRTCRNGDFNFEKEETFSILYLSAEMKNLGKILYANGEACQALGGELAGTNFFSMLVYPFNFELKKSIEHCLRVGVSIKKLSNSLSLIEDHQKNIHSVKVKPILLSSGCRPLIMLCIRKLEKDKILLSKDLVVMNHSPDLFKEIEEMRCEPFGKKIGRYMEEFLPGFNSQYETALQGEINQSTDSEFSRIKKKSEMKNINGGAFHFKYFNENTFEEMKMHVFQIKRDSETISILCIDAMKMTCSLFMGGFGFGMPEPPPETENKYEKSNSSFDVFETNSLNCTEAEWATKKNRLNTMTKERSMLAEFSKNEQKLTKGTRILKIVYFILIVTQIIGVAISLILAVRLIDRVQENSIFKQLVNRRSFAIDLGQHIVTLNLIYSELYPVERQDHVIKAVNGLLNGFEESINTINDAMEEWDSENKFPYVKSVVPVWEFSNNQYFELRSNLVDISFKILLSAKQILEHLNWDTSNSQMFYIYRNTFSEVYKYYNGTFFSLIDYEYELRQTQFSQIYILNLLCLGILALLVSVLVLPRVFELDKCNRFLWEQFLEMPNALLFQICDKVRTRLENVHSSQAVSDIVTKSKTKPKIPKKWPLLLLKLSIFPVITILFTYFVYIFYIERLQMFVNTIPNYLNWVGMQHSSLITSYYWLREHYLTKLDSVGYKYIVQEGQYVVSPSEYFQKEIETLRISLQVLEDGSEDYGIYDESITDELYDLYYKSACEVTQGCKSSLWSGILPGINDYINIAEMYIQKTDWENWDEIINLEIRLEEVAEACYRWIETYEKYSMDRLNSFKTLFIATSVLYIVASILLYLVSINLVMNDYANFIRKMSNFTIIFYNT